MAGVGAALATRRELARRRFAQPEPKNMYLVHCAVDCTASIAGGLISFDIDASLIYTTITSGGLGVCRFNFVIV